MAVLTRTLLQLCGELAASGAGEVAEHIRSAIDERRLDAGSLLLASLSRDQAAIRTGAVHRGLAPDLVWLVAELAVGPFAHALQRAIFASASRAPDPTSSPGDDPLADALHRWHHGYCPACGSWPAMAEVVDGHRTLRCSFCATAWELTTYACVYCGEDGEPFVTAAPDEERKDRRVEVCSGCGGYMKTVDTAALSPFPLLAIGDLETMDLDMAAMEHGYAKPAMKEFGASKLVSLAAWKSGRASSFEFLAYQLTKSPIVSRCFPDSCSISLCRLFPCASIVTIAGKSLTRRCHIASGVPNSSSDTSSTPSIVRA